MGWPGRGEAAAAISPGTKKNGVAPKRRKKTAAPGAEACSSYDTPATSLRAPSDVPGRSLGRVGGHSWRSVLCGCGREWGGGPRAALFFVPDGGHSPGDGSGR